MNIGIVGSEGKKFTPETEESARKAIRILLPHYQRVVSGGCHLGGIDIWCIEEAKKLNMPTQEFLPKTRDWEGYRHRNILIAKYSDLVVCITVKTLPPDYRVMGFERYCYHCGTDQHIKSGGCWTVKYARKIGKQGQVIVIGESDGSKSEQHEV